MPVSRAEYEEKNVAAAYWMREFGEAQSLLMHEREESAKQLDAHIEATKKAMGERLVAIRERDEAKQMAFACQNHTAAITRAMGKVRTATAQITESSDELKHWLSKHLDSADLDTDLILDPDKFDLGEHHG
jgi:uncharacterized protein YicC (UPF0701 family)